MNSAMAVSAPQCDFVGTLHSTLTHHGECCQLARRWLYAMHRSKTFGRTDQQKIQAPIWLKRHFKWGPVQWPLSWCEAVQRTSIDCGVFAAFAREIFEQADEGHFEIYPAQIILDQPKTFTDQWSMKWSPVFRDFNWIGEGHVYHEVCAIVDTSSDRVRIYDPTEGVWIDPMLERGINNVIGVNIKSPRMLDWGTLRVGLDQWHML